MATEFGIGVRVYVGWVPPQESQNHVRAIACFKCGTIIDGPRMVTPGDVGHRICLFRRFFTARYPAAYWMVRLDTGRDISAEERYLFPIDDGDETIEREEREEREDDHVPE